MEQQVHKHIISLTTDTDITETILTEHFMEASILAIVVDPVQRKWEIQLQLPQVLPVAILRAFLQTIETKYQKKDLNIDWEIQYTKEVEITNELVESYWHELITYKINELNINVAHATKGIAYSQKTGLVIKASNSLAEKTLINKNLPLIVSKIYKKYLNTDIQVRVKSSADNLEQFDAYLERKKELENQCLQDAYVVAQACSTQATKKQEVIATDLVIGKDISKEVPVKISQLIETPDSQVIAGQTFSHDSRKINNETNLHTFNITDKTDSIKVKIFSKKEKTNSALAAINTGAYLKVRGKLQYDKYDDQEVFMASDICYCTVCERQDRAEQKRVELHLHTTMSSMDGVSSLKSLFCTAQKWGHQALAITDHGVLQAFPEAWELSQKHNVKAILGIEAYLIKDRMPIVYAARQQSLFSKNTTYVVFDVETTGLSSLENSLTEIAAVKIRDGQIIDEMQTLIKPHELIPEKITKLTGIDNNMVVNAPSLELAMQQFIDFIDDAILVAHNAAFDMGFIQSGMWRLAKPAVANPIIDTVALARHLLPGLKAYKLDKLCQHLEIKLDKHHRALYDATATGHLLIKLLQQLKTGTVEDLAELAEIRVNNKSVKHKAWHCVMLVQNLTGLKNLYKLVSLAHINNFYRTPRIFESELLEHREGLIIGSACEAGELYQAVMQNMSEQRLIEIAQFYDYLEIQPLGNNEFLLGDKFNAYFKNRQHLQQLNMRIYQLGQKINKPVVATCDVHFLQPEDAIYREILMTAKKFDDASNQAPLYFRTTEEMLAEFEWMGAEIARDVVITQSNIINEMIEKVAPFPDDLFTPVIEGAEEQIRAMSYNKARQYYGEQLPDLVTNRLEKELDSIIGNGFAVIYLISQKIVCKSLEDGYLVGSRGSVGSSFVATMTDITEVNPLPPHYRCPQCRYSQFMLKAEVNSGFDLPDKNCPDCNTKLLKDGHDIPFETFMGFKGDKVPDIDLNFSGEYQPRAHQYVEELFGKQYVYRAGTISTIADKTAYGYVKNYMEVNGKQLRSAEIERLALGCTGVKRTTGQHPGGQMIIPEYKEVYDFTPIQFPADAEDTDYYTTHFDYHAISGRLLKLDILGHDDPTIIRMLQDITNINPSDIPIDDPLTMSLFNSTTAIGVTPEDLDSPVATFAIPEFGTKFVRQMLEDTRPTTFAELVRISGLSHGTDVWLNNAQKLVREKKAVLAEVISTRDDIMVYLIHKGLEQAQAFTIMEKVRKGKGLTADDEQLMKKHKVPDWYIWSCNQIKYMFPKAHAVAYVLMAVRIAYFKVHHPLAFYAAYFSVRAVDFEVDVMLKGGKAIKKHIKELMQKGKEITKKEEKVITVLEVAYEMTLRGFEFYHIDLQKSDAYNFKIGSNGLIIPFAALPGVGKSAAANITAALKNQEILSIQDLREKSKASKTVIDALKQQGCLNDLPEENQLSLF